MFPTLHVFYYLHITHYILPHHIISGNVPHIVLSMIPIRNLMFPTLRIFYYYISFARYPLYIILHTLNYRGHSPHYNSLCMFPTYYIPNMHLLLTHIMLCILHISQLKCSPLYINLCTPYIIFPCILYHVISLHVPHIRSILMLT